MRQKHIGIWFWDINLPRMQEDVLRGLLVEALSSAQIKSPLAGGP
jgi:hypothetical protein